MKIITKNSRETTILGFTLAKKLKGGEILALRGDLGGGKTTFIKGLGKGLGIKKRILSPTFILMNPYFLKKKKIKFFYHLDLYRLKKPAEVLSAGLLEDLGEPDTIFGVEWAEKIRNILPKKTIWVTFKHLGKNSRKVEIKGKYGN